MFYIVEFYFITCLLCTCTYEYAKSLHTAALAVVHKIAKKKIIINKTKNKKVHKHKNDVLAYLNKYTKMLINTFG